MTTKVTDEQRSETAAEFLKKLDGLDRGEWAILKRNAGNTLAEARNATWFYRLLEGDGWQHPEINFLVASLYCTATRYGAKARICTGDFGATMRQLAEAAGSDSMKRRFSILLDAEFDWIDGKPAGGELAYRLRQSVKLAASHEIGIDWPQLLVDLCHWSWPGKRVQQKWAKSFYAPRLDAERAKLESDEPMTSETNKGESDVD